MATKRTTPATGSASDRPKATPLRVVASRRTDAGLARPLQIATAFENKSSNTFTIVDAKSLRDALNALDLDNADFLITLFATPYQK